MRKQQLALELGAGSDSAPNRPAAPQRQGPKPFNYTNALREVIDDLIATLEELQHIDSRRVLLSISQARQRSKYGVYASCLPLRFEGGALEVRSGKSRWRWPVLQHGGHEILYVIYVMLPRFHQEQDYAEKLATIIHELYHISPHFNGDLRRFPGRNFAHGSSREAYHAAMRQLAARYLATSPRADDWNFLRAPFEELLAHPGGVVGYQLRKPSPVRIP